MPETRLQEIERMERRYEELALEYRGLLRSFDLNAAAVTLGAMEQLADELRTARENV